MIRENDVMDWGVYKGCLVKEVPARYWIDMYGLNYLPPHYRKYVRQNYDELLKQKTDEANKKATEGRRNSSDNT